MERAIALYHNHVAYRVIMNSVLILAAAYIGISIGMAYTAQFTRF